MGYRPVVIPLDLPEFADEDNPGDSLRVSVVAPSVRQGERMNAGRLDGESSEQFANTCWGFLVPKIRSWNLEDDKGEPVPLPSQVGLDIADPERRLAAQVEHLRDQDENVVYAIFKAWRIASLTPKENTAEGKDSATPSTSGHDESSPSGTNWDIRELESQIPM